VAHSILVFVCFLLKKSPDRFLEAECDVPGLYYFIEYLPSRHDLIGRLRPPRPQRVFFRKRNPASVWSFPFLRTPPLGGGPTHIRPRTVFLCFSPKGAIYIFLPPFFFGCIHLGSLRLLLLRRPDPFITQGTKKTPYLSFLNHHLFEFYRRMSFLLFH